VTSAGIGGSWRRSSSESIASGIINGVNEEERIIRRRNQRPAAKSIEIISM